MINWHRLFGVILTDYFVGTPFDVELEKDLSQRQQLLDVVVIRRGEGEADVDLPDGIDNLADHNLLTFKSHHEALDDWALDELIGHYVPYRKFVRLEFEGNDLVPADQFRLFAVSARFPKKLAKQREFEPVDDGVYNVIWGSRVVRVIVLRELPHEEQNAGVHIFSADPDDVAYGMTQFRARLEEATGAMNDVVKYYRLEGWNMPFTIADYRRELLERMTPEERVEGLPPEQRIAGLPPEERIIGLSDDEIERLFQTLKERRARRNESSDDD